MINQKYAQLKGVDQMLEERDQVMIDLQIRLLNNYNLIHLRLMKGLMKMEQIKMIYKVFCF